MCEPPEPEQPKRDLFIPILVGVSFGGYALIILYDVFFGRGLCGITAAKLCGCLPAMLTDFAAPTMANLKHNLTINGMSAEEVFNSARITHNWADAENIRAVKSLLDGVRKHGSYKRYMRAPHRDVLACRGLAQRGKLSTEHRALNFLAKQGDNGIVWTVLSYWRATE